MEPKALIYLVMGLVYLVVQYQRAQKKKQQQTQQRQGQQDNTTTTVNRPIQPPTPEKDKDVFRNIFEKAQDQLDRRREEDRQKTATPKRFAPPPRREYVPITPVKEELDENYTDTSMKEMIQYEQPRDLRTHVAAAAVNYQDDLTNPILDNFDLRNALIAQIILERPEF